MKSEAHRLAFSFASARSAPKHTFRFRALPDRNNTNSVHRAVKRLRVASPQAAERKQDVHSGGANHTIGIYRKKTPLSSGGASRPAARYRKKTPELLRVFSFWCGHRDLNSDGVNHTPLKRTRLPVPPWPHSENSILLSFPFVNGFERVLSRKSRAEYYVRMYERPAEFNALAALLAETLCRGRSPAENAELLRFLNLLCSLVKSYL